MRKILRNRLALSTVITTLIILVVSVLLAGVVTYFAINVVSTRVQQESLALSYTHVWVNSTGIAQAAVLVKNTGGRDVVINAIQVRGIAASGNVYTKADTTDPGSLSPLTAWTGYTKTTGQIILSSGGMVAIYICEPTSVSINDVGTTIGITVFTANAMYYQETNVQAAPPGTNLPTS
jgi:hypothetical protein